MGKPSLLNQTLYPGAKTRYDDFVAVHINQTLSIHGTGNFLGWHRYFVYTYEQALRNECGYKGYQPVSAPQRSVRLLDAKSSTVLELGHKCGKSVPVSRL